MEGTDETHDEGDCECEYGEKQERPVNKRGRRRQRRQTQVRQERIQEKAEKSMANVQASEASVASAFGSEPSLCGDPSYARLGLIVDGEGKALTLVLERLCPSRDRDEEWRLFAIARSGNRHRRWCCRRRCHLLLHHPPFLPRAAWRCLQRRVARLHDKPNPGLPGAPHCLLAWLAAWPHRAMHA